MTNGALDDVYYQSQIGPADSYTFANNAKRATINSVYIDPRPWSALFNKQIDCDQWGIDQGLCAYGLAWGEDSLPDNGLVYVPPSNDGSVPVVARLIARFFLATVTLRTTLWRFEKPCNI